MWCAGFKDAALPGGPHSDADEHEPPGLPATEGGDPGHQR